MVVFEVVDEDKLDHDDFTNLQKEAYVNLLTRLKVSSVYMKPYFYKWKFHPPAGPARIVLVEDG